MIAPFMVKEAAEKLEDSNIKFRSFLKNRADSDELDAHYLKLHNELFAEYDCNKCRNCCKIYDTYLDDNEIKNIAEFLKLSVNDFVDKYLKKTDEGFKINGKPCCFLLTDGRCQIEECKPTSCIDYPYTNKSDRLFSLLGMLGFVEVCPVAFEIFERLKEIYSFMNRVH